MREVLKMWKSTKMIVLTALTAAIYAAILIPFKAIPLIPGITELRPGNMIPVAFGLFFGPAGAWGAAIGNTIGDLIGGSSGWGSVFGFVGNFLFAFIPYKLWDNLGFLGGGNTEPDCKNGKKISLYLISAIVASAACGLVIAWGVDLLGLVPFAALGCIIPINNAVAAIFLGLPITILLFPRIKKWDLYWKDVMNEEDLPKGGAIAKTAAIAMILFVIGGLVISLFVAFGAGQIAFQFGGDTRNMGVVLIAGIASIGTLITGYLQN